MRNLPASTCSWWNTHHSDPAGAQPGFIGGPAMAWGQAPFVDDETTNICWVVGEQLTGRWDVPAVINLCAHEIGHVFTDPEHPDRGKGVAPLMGTTHIYRLMFSFPATRQGNLLVKAEWDKAEQWLIRVVDGNN